MNGEEHAAEHEGFVARKREQRLAKLEELRRPAIDPYRPRYDRDRTAAQIHDRFDDLEASKETEAFALAFTMELARRHRAGRGSAGKEADRNRAQSFFQIESLRDFNRKFQPEWLPRSIVIEDPAAPPRVGALYATIEGFLKLPVIGSLLVGSVPSSNGAVARTHFSTPERA